MNMNKDSEKVLVSETEPFLSSAEYDTTANRSSQKRTYINQIYALLHILLITTYTILFVVLTQKTSRLSTSLHRKSTHQVSEKNAELIHRSNLKSSY